MAVVNISLPDKMKDYVEQRLSEGGYSTTSEYFRDLIREDQKKRAAVQLEAMLVQGIESPDSPWSKGDIEKIKSAVRDRMARKTEPNE